VSGGQQVPPAWYPDPQNAGSMRWWDGSNWTEHTVTAPAREPEKVPPPTATGWRKWRSLIIAAAVVVGGLAAIVIADASGGSSSPAGTQAAVACQDVVTASHEVVVGERSPSSYRSLLAGAESRARGAAQSDARYTGILNAIVQIRGAVQGGGNASASLDYLRAQCG
jgi:hypothetical protein